MAKIPMHILVMHVGMVASILRFCRRIARIPADAAAGWLAQNVIGIIPNDVDVHEAKDNSDSLLLRLSDKTEVGNQGLERSLGL